MKQRRSAKKKGRKKGRKGQRNGANAQGEEVIVAANPVELPNNAHPVAAPPCLQQLSVSTAHSETRNDQSITMKLESEQHPSNDKRSTEQTSVSGTSDVTLVVPSNNLLVETCPCIHISETRLACSNEEGQEIVAFAEAIFAADFSTGTSGFLDTTEELLRVHPKAARHPSVVHYLYGYMTQRLLEGAGLAAAWRQVAKVLEFAFYLENVHHCAPTEEDSDRNLKLVLRFCWCYAQHARNEHDIVTYLDKKIPCQCLAGLKKIVLELTETRTCCNPTCKNGFVTKRTGWCSKCLKAEYCSKTCQAAHWPFHQNACFEPSTYLRSFVPPEILEVFQEK